MSLPAELRIKIWGHCLPTEIEFDVDVSFAGLRPSPTTIQVSHLPSNPAVPLLLICQQVAAEVATIPRPSLIAALDGRRYVEWLRNTPMSYRRHLSTIRLRETRPSLECSFPTAKIEAMSVVIKKLQVGYYWKNVEIISESGWQLRVEQDKVEFQTEERTIELEVSEPLK